jgi:hypothetical protein
VAVALAFAAVRSARDRERFWSGQWPRRRRLPVALPASGPALAPAVAASAPLVASALPPVSEPEPVFALAGGASCPAQSKCHSQAPASPRVHCDSIDVPSGQTRAVSARGPHAAASQGPVALALPASSSVPPVDVVVFACVVVLLFALR